MAIAKELDVDVGKVVIVDGSVVFDAGSKRGDGFSSEVVAVDVGAVVDGTTISKNFIVKTNPGGEKGEMLATVNFSEEAKLSKSWIVKSVTVGTKHKK